MKKRISAIGLVVCMITILIGGNLAINASEQTVTITVNGVVVESDVEAYVNDDDRTMVPVRFVSEALGATVGWEEASQTVTIVKDSSTMILTIGSSAYTLDGVEMAMDTEAVIVSDRTMVPVRFVSEALGNVVNWDDATYTVLISDGDTDEMLPPPDGMGSEDGEMLPPPDGMEELDSETSEVSMFQDAIDQGVITAEEALVLSAYLEENDPKNGGTGTDTPFADAATEGLITETQATTLASMIDLTAGMDSGSDMPPMDGDSEGGMVSTESTYTVEEANAIEAELLAAVGYTAAVDGYPIVDTNQTRFFSNDGVIDEPAEGEDFYGQDASYTGNAPSYTDNGDGTVSDNVTGLMWQQDPGDKLTWAEAVEYLDEFNEEALGGYSDWRIPTMKELYSLVDFSGYTRTSSDTSNPYIDTDYFVFLYGDEAGEPRFIDSQILTSTIYDATTLGGNTTVFGYNFADGRIKGYEIDKDFYCYFVRGNTNYGQNLYVDNGDETITDEATSLMWSQYDSGYYEAGTEADGTLDWQEALEWVADMNDEEFLGYSDWRLPNIKELQSMADYSQSPMTTGTPSIDSIFYCTPIINAWGEDDYGYYWSGTTHDDTSASVIEYNAASYMVVGNAMGEMDGEVVDAHGSGSQKSDPKTGDREDYPAPDENAPQGDEQRVYNMVRLVRDAD